jgi:nucleotide-binding universal stress UspA family protein
MAILELPENWLIATDGSTYASMSVQYAAKLYRFYEPKPNVLLLNVIRDPRTTSMDESSASAKDREKAKVVLAEARELFAESAGTAETVSTMVAIGEPRHVIVEVSRIRKIDHVIMGGSDYQWKITDLLSGGVTNYIMHHLNCVITIIK